MEKSALLRSKRLYLLDMDGTLYLGNRLYPFTKALLDALRSTGRRYLFMTNNSSKSVDAYIGKLQAMGIEATREDFMTSTQATIFYLQKHHPGLTFYLCGTVSMEQELLSAGISLSRELSQVDAVLMGFDTELTFRKLEDVSKLLLKNKDMPYIATNPDLVCPTEFGSVPDCGSVCQMLYNVTGRRPVVIGKPSALMPQLAMEKLGFSPEKTAVVGDRIYTDVKSALNAGVTGILVLSGETTREILEASPDKPHLVLEDASEILQAITE